MKSLQSNYYYLAAMGRRNKGLYDEATLKLFQQTCQHSNSAKRWLAYARFQRDIHGKVDTQTIDKLQQIEAPSTSQQVKIEQLMLEAQQLSNTKITPKYLTPVFTELHLQQPQWRQALTAYLKHKSIAIVGNGTSLLSSNLGQQVDSHEVICRFNHFPKDPKTHPDIGQRTDIWVISPEVATAQVALPNYCRWIILTGPDARFTLQNWQWARSYLTQGCRIITIPVSNWSDLVRQFKAPPSAGALWLHYLQSIPSQGRTLHLYGFDKKNHSKRYHITSAKFKASSRHHWTAERSFLNQFTQNPQVQRHQDAAVAVFTKGLLNNPCIKHHLRSSELIYQPDTLSATSPDYVIGWGRKRNTIPAINFATKHNLDYFTLEDGFIHSMSQGRLGAKSWSLVKDKTGIYYDASQPSDLEILINNTSLSTEERFRAKKCIEKIHRHHITKYNNAKLVITRPLSEINNAILVIDQVDGDTSIPYAYADRSSFNRMMKTALDENPNIPIIVKVHPDVINGKRRGCIELDITESRVTILSENINPLVLLKKISKVYVVSSQMGFEALLLGKEVICFGVPFYAGWGLTDDRVHSPAHNRRQTRPDLITLFHCAYIGYSLYIHPETKRPCEIETILDFVALQNTHYKRNAGNLICLGLTPWKRRFVKHFLKSNDNNIHFIKNAEQGEKLNITDPSKVYIWSSRYAPKAAKLQEKLGYSITKIEDGFIRSIGLGVNYTLPSSLAFDKTGIYFDPNTPSELESILSGCDFDEALCSRARKLIDLIIEKKVSKYNQIANQQPLDKLRQPGKPVLLVPGQVTDDESIKRGCPGISDNLSLLKQVRKKNPNATIVYKPHPDVVSGYRSGAIQPSEYCDLIIDDVAISDCLGYVDEVHTLTSLVGFEALLRNIKVHCYGIPFYAGWGLTTDEYITKRRKRQLTTEELVAGTLLLYPSYYNWETSNFTTAESVVYQMSSTKESTRFEKHIATRLPKSLRSLIQITAAIIKAH